MKCKLKEIPKDGDKRTITKFAWLPQVVNKYGINTGRYLIWFEHYSLEQEYEDGEKHYDSWSGWITKLKYI